MSTIDHIDGEISGVRQSRMCEWPIKIDNHSVKKSKVICQRRTAHNSYWGILMDLPNSMDDSIPFIVFRGKWHMSIQLRWAKVILPFSRYSCITQQVRINPVRLWWLFGTSNTNKFNCNITTYTSISLTQSSLIISGMFWWYKFLSVLKLVNKTPKAVTFRPLRIVIFLAFRRYEWKQQDFYFWVVNLA